MDGIQLARELRTLEKDESFLYELKIVLVTAEDYDNQDKLFDNVYYKPLPINNITEVYNK